MLEVSSRLMFVHSNTNLAQSVSQVAGTKCAKTPLGLDMSTTREERMTRTWSKDHFCFHFMQHIYRLSVSRFLPVKC